MVSCFKDLLTSKYISFHTHTSSGYFGKKGENPILKKNLTKYICMNLSIYNTIEIQVRF